MKEANLDPEKMKDMNMVKLMSFSLVFALMIALALNPMVIHQMHLSSIVMNQIQGTDATAKTAAEADIANIMANMAMNLGLLSMVLFMDYYMWFF